MSWIDREMLINLSGCTLGADGAAADTELGGETWRYWPNIFFSAVGAGLTALHTPGNEIDTINKTIIFFIRGLSPFGHELVQAVGLI